MGNGLYRDIEALWRKNPEAALTKQVIAFQELTIEPIQAPDDEISVRLSKWGYYIGRDSLIGAIGKTADTLWETTALSKGQFVVATTNLMRVFTRLADDASDKKISDGASLSLNRIADQAMHILENDVGFSGRRGLKAFAKMRALSALGAEDAGQWHRQGIYARAAINRKVGTSVGLSALVKLPAVVRTLEADVVRSFAHACDRDLNGAFVYEALTRIVNHPSVGNPTASWLEPTRQSALARLKAAQAERAANGPA